MADRSDVSQHILPTAATMVGVCATVIGIVRLVETNSAISTIIDEILAIDAVVFLGSTLLSYAALRDEGDTPRVERVADWLFLGGLGILVVACFMLAWEVGQVGTATR